MLSAGEALTIAREVNRSDIELKEIESYIRNTAMNGKYRITLYPSIQYHPKTIKELKLYGYRVTSYIDKTQHHYSYCIEWGEDSDIWED